MTKQVIITKFEATVEGENLILKALFKLAPSKRVFSRMRADLRFDEHFLKSIYVGMPYYLARQQEFPLQTVLGLEDISAGKHTIRLEMLGLWPSAGPSDFMEASFEHEPLRKVFRARAIPTIKKFEGPSIGVVTDEADKLYGEMKDRWKRETKESRDGW
jgi:hypothetical protein